MVHNNPTIETVVLLTYHREIYFLTNFLKSQNYICHLDFVC